MPIVRSLIANMSACNFRSPALLGRGLCLCVATIFFCVAPRSALAAQLRVELGKVAPKVTARDHPEQSYALYLPSSYDAKKQWPIVYAFDPAARGALPVELMKDAAEKYGYIVAGSNNSRNGSWKVEAEAAKAMFDDTQGRLSIDPKRVYFAGFSGGSRVSSDLAARCSCAAGVFLAGAGFQPGEKNAPARPRFAVFSSAGLFDFNYGEVLAMDEALQKAGAAHYLRRFDGLHQWPPAEALGEALAWFRLMAVKAGAEARDDGFIHEQFTLRAKAAEALETADPYAAWFEYRQAAETFDGLADVSSWKAKVQTLEKQKAIADGLKREKQEIRDQKSLLQPIFDGFSSMQQDAGNSDKPRAALRDAVQDQIISLRSQAEREKRPERLRVLKRALGEILVSAMETGSGRQEARDQHGARDFFELATAADPDAVWPLMNVAIARANDGETKSALESLRRLKKNWKDRDAFVSWLTEQKAFDRLRDNPGYTALIQ